MRNFFVLLLFSATIARGGFERSDAGARARSLGGAYTALGADAWAAFHNPAGLARISGPEAGFFFSPRPFGLDELAYSAGTAAFPIAPFAVGLAASRYGFSLYREDVLSLCVALRGPLIDLGIAVSYCSAAIERYGTRSAVALHAGATVALPGALRIAIRLRNLNAPRIGAPPERLRQSAALGAAYGPLGGVTLVADLHKEILRKPSLRAGAEFIIVPPLVLRTGIADEPAQVHAGVGIRHGIAALDYAFSLHDELGATHECSITLRWGGGDEK